jgi:hypothetical protein
MLKGKAMTALDFRRPAALLCCAAFRVLNHIKAPMATKELRDLRHKYKAAYTNYMHCVQALSDASQAGTLPPGQVLKLEDEAIHELNSVRQALLDALYEHTIKRNGAATPE